MAEIKHICIGIQARSTSVRFPRKVFEMIGDKPMLSHVIDNCKSAAQYSNNYTHKNKMVITVAILIPTGDEIGSAFQHHRIAVIDGPEKDVLSRYVKMSERMNADYIVRVTGDCPLLPHFLVGKAITVALKNQFDYVSNVDEEIRTAADGFDVEVFSRRALDWVNENAKSEPEREHVTLLLRSKQIPRDFKIGHIVGYLDLAHVKLSVDNQEDLERVRAHYGRIQMAIQKAEALHGKGSIHRY